MLKNIYPFLRSYCLAFFLVFNDLYDVSFLCVPPPCKWALFIDIDPFLKNKCELKSKIVSLKLHFGHTMFILIIWYIGLTQEQPCEEIVFLEQPFTVTRLASDRKEGFGERKCSKSMEI